MNSHNSNNKAVNFIKVATWAIAIISGLRLLSYALFNDWSNYTLPGTASAFIVAVLILSVVYYLEIRNLKDEKTPE